MDAKKWSRTFLLLALGLFLTAAALASLPVNAANFDVDDCGSLFQPKNNDLEGVTDDDGGDDDTFQFFQECRDALDTRFWMAAAAVTPGVVALAAAGVVRSLRHDE